MKKNNILANLKAPSEKPPVQLNVETAQATVQVYGVHEKYGLLESYKGCFVKNYQIGDNNYLTATEEEQEADYRGWRRLLNSFGQNTEFSITIYDRMVNQQDFCDSVLIKENGDDYDHLRKQMNKIILDRINEGKNGIIKDKYLTVSVHAANPKKAAEVFSRLDRDINKSLSKIKSFARVLSLEETLDLLYGVYNDGDEHLIQKTRVVDEDGHVSESKSFDFNNMRSMGLSITDLLAPSSVRITGNCIHFGDKLARVLKVNQLPSQLNDEFLNNVTDMNFCCMTTVNYKPIPPKKADAIIAKNLSFVRDEKRRAQKQGQKAGVYDDSYVNPAVLDREAEILALRDAMHEKDEKLFDTSLTVIVFADNMEKLNEYTDSIITEYKKASVAIAIMTGQQEEGFNSTLPIGFNQIVEKRTLTSSSGAILIPFSTLELNDPGGINYSCNLISRNLIVYDRMSANNFNGFVLGTPGSGKSFTSKVEMLNVFLKTNSDIVVIDPEDEYGPMAKMLGGEVIKIVPGGDVHINPMEIVSDTDFDADLNPINAKSDFILKVCECILNSPFGLDSIQQTIVDECVHALFAPYMVEGKLREIDPNRMPTLTDLQVLLGKRPEPEARQLAMALKLYSGNGSLNAFGYRTNVHTNARFVVYQIRDIGDRLKPLAMLTILDHIWNQIVENRKIGKNTWFFVDEIYLLFQQDYSAQFLDTLFRRARKYGGVPTGMTQNVTAMLSSEHARSMISNCSFVVMLNQAPVDREQLVGLLNLSAAQAGYVTNSPKGQGLLYNGKSVVPFYSQFPKDNDIYRVLTSDLKEIKEFEAQERREKAMADKKRNNIA